LAHGWRDAFKLLSRMKFLFAGTPLDPFVAAPKNAGW